MKDVISIILWIPVLLMYSFPLVLIWPFVDLSWWQAFLPIGLVPLGVIAVPFTKPDHPIWGNNEHPVPPKWYRPGQNEKWRDYCWRAFRNPVNNIRYLLDEPKPDVVKGVLDPDDSVRSGKVKSAWRWTRASLFSEYWYLRKKGDGYFEFRIGWKFSDVPGFGPTIQLGPRNR